MERRHVIGSGLAGISGLLAASGGASASAASSDGEDGTITAAAIDRLRQSLERQFDACELGPCHAIETIRAQQHAFLRAAQKYPDYIEVGLDVWDSVYDFHVKHQQPITTARLPDGRYTMTFMFTNLLLRPDQALDFVGYPFDGEPPAAGRPAP